MTIPKCSICGWWFPLSPIQFVNGIVCRTCFEESGLPTDNLSVAYKNTPVHVVLENRDRVWQAENRRKALQEGRKAAAELERKRKMTPAELKRERKKIAEEKDKALKAHLREVAAKRQYTKDRKEVVFRSRLFMENDAIIFCPHAGQIAIREMNETKEYKLEKILEFEVLEGGFSIAKGGLGRAVVGALIFGGAGAVVGAVTGGKKSKDVVTSLQLKLTLDDLRSPVRYIEFLSVESKRDGALYKESKERLSEVVAMFKVMFKKYEEAHFERQRETAKEAKEAEERSPTSCADELIKLKGLLDQGVITKTEFQKQKRKVLQ